MNQKARTSRKSAGAYLPAMEQEVPAVRTGTSRLPVRQPSTERALLARESDRALWPAGGRFGQLLCRRSRGPV
jgi:hypothetical protein